MSKLTVQQQEKFSRKRILKDYYEILQNPIPSVVAHPLPSNIYEWHGNFLGLSGTGYQDAVFHIKIHLKINYPQTPPIIELCNYLNHAHVYQQGKFICLDMLESWDGFKKDEKKGWTSGYTIQSVLIQLQSFFMDTNEVSTSKSDIQQTLKSCATFQCKDCGHSLQRIWPPLPILEKKEKELLIVEKKEEKRLFLDKGLLYKVFLYLDLKTMKKVHNTCHTFRDITKLPIFEHRKQICCYHTKMTYEEALLGVGITLEMGRLGISYVHSTLDLVSSFAFNYENLRTSLWKEKFTHWIPVYINKRHGKYALEFLQPAIKNIYGSFTPKLALDLFTKLMNSMVVEVMKMNMHASLKALDGYVMFHRLLIALVTEYPELKKGIDEKIKKFIDQPKLRRKSATSSMGDFLPLLTVSSYSWEDVALPVIQETMVRNVLWIINSVGEEKFKKLLGEKSSSESMKKERESVFFEGSKTSLRLMMFHVYFLKHFTPKKGQSLKDIAHIYDENYGYADEHIKNDLQSEIKKIIDVSDIQSFFKQVYLLIDPKLIDSILLDCIVKSDEFKYTSINLRGHEKIKAEEKKKKIEIYKSYY